MAGSKFKSLRPFSVWWESQLVPRVRGGAMVSHVSGKVAVGLEQSTHLLEGDSRVPGGPQYLPGVCSLHGRHCTGNVTEQSLVFSLSTPGNACFNRPQGCCVCVCVGGLPWLRDELDLPTQPSHCEDPTKDTFAEFSCSAPNRTGLFISTWNSFAKLLILRSWYLVLLLARGAASAVKASGLS